MDAVDAVRRAPGARRRAGRSRARSGWAQRGAAAVEFALVLPILFLLVFGIVDFGLYINAASVAGNAAREGARAASLGASSAQIDGIVRSALAGLPGSGATSVATTCRTPAGASCATYDTGAASGGTAVITVDYVHEWITPVGLGSSVTITTSSEMRIE